MKKFCKFYYLLDRYCFLVTFFILAVGTFAGYLNVREHLAIYLVVFAIGMVGSIILIYIILHYKNYYCNEIKEYCKKTGVSMEELEADFEKMYPLSWRVRIGERWIFFMDQSFFPNVVAKEDIAGVNYATEGDGKGYYRLAVCHLKNREIVKIPCSKKNEKQMEIICGKQPKMLEVLGKRDNKKHVFKGCIMYVMMLVLIGVMYWQKLPEMLISTCWILIGTGILLWIVFKCSKNQLRYIKEYCKNQKIALAALEDDFGRSIQIGKNLWVGNVWIYYVDKNYYPEVMRKSDITQIVYPNGKKKGKLSFYHNDNVLAVIRVNQIIAEKLKKIV